VPVFIQSDRSFRQISSSFLLILQFPCLRWVGSSPLMMVGGGGGGRGGKGIKIRPSHHKFIPKFFETDGEMRRPKHHSVVLFSFLL
jgi:hypothetical protein